MIVEIERQLVALAVKSEAPVLDAVGIGQQRKASGAERVCRTSQRAQEIKSPETVRRDASAGANQGCLRFWRSDMDRII
jgi:hypothetical protein